MIIAVVGPFGMTAGVGTVAESVAAALETTPDLSVHRIPWGPGVSESTALDKQPDVVIACVNADAMRAWTSSQPHWFPDGPYIIGLWFWETDRMPPTHEAGFRCVDEVWTLSAHCTQVFSQAAGCEVPVTTMPIPLGSPERTRSTASRSDRDAILHLADVRSGLERKNTHGLITAYQDAFAHSDAAPDLHLKLTGTEHNPTALEYLHQLAHTHESITIDTLDVPRNEVLDRIRCAGLVVSLHRGEGLGLPIYEAAVSGTPVLATGWSGTESFLTLGSHHSRVPYTLVPVPPWTEHGSPNALWAEPKLQSASQALTDWWENRELWEGRATSLARELATTHGPSNFASAALQRLATAKPARPKPLALAAATRAQTGIAAERAARRGLRAKAAAFTLGGLERGLVDTVDGLVEERQQTAREIADLRAELARLNHLVAQIVGERDD